MSSSEAGPSSAPLFKKRGKSHTTSRISTAVTDEPPASTLASDTQPQDQLSVQDLIALRALSRKPTGIELQRLNKGERRKTQKGKSASQLEEERWEQQMKRGGLVNTADKEPDESDEDDSSKPRRLVRKNNFQGETGTVDVDKHMMEYIEREMRKRTNGNSNSSSSSNEAQDAASIANATSSEDSLYALAEKYRELQRSIKPEQTQDEREGNVALSAAMLSSIPEVDLGIDTRMKNIQQTEAAKRQLLEQQRHRSANGSVARDEDFANARFQHAKQRNSHSDLAGKGGERKQMATDQLVLDRFRKRQRNFR